MNVILKELLLSMIMDLPWLIQGHLNQVQSLMFFQVNVSKYFTQRYLVKIGWSYVVRYDPRGRPVKYNHVVEDEDNNEEEDHDYADQEQVAHVVDVSDEEVEEVDHPNVGDDDLIDDIDNYSSKNDIDDDVDRNEPFTNINSEPDPDTDVELDEEEDD
jgi:hypothetical protein